MRIAHLALITAVAFAPSLAAQKALTNKDIWYSNQFSAERVGGLASMNDGEHYTAMDEQGGEVVIEQFAYRTGEKTATILKGAELVPPGGGPPVEVDDYSFSGDEQKLMITTDSEPIYRHSSKAYNYVFDRATRKLSYLSDRSKPKQQLATFSPDGSRAAFVRENDLFVVELGSGKETQVTSDGAWGKVINGAVDWVYEEEFSYTQGYAWSPDGTRILYMRSDESAVKEFDLTYYREQLYPSEYRFKYPKAGEVNSSVSLHLYDIPTGTSTLLPLGTEERDIYIPRLGFTPGGTPWFMRLNRLQNEKLILAVDMPKPGTKARPVTRELYRERSATYIEVTDDLHFLEDGSGFVLSSEQSGWNHIHFCSLAMVKGAAPAPRALTSGKWDVLAVNGIDERNKRVVFTANRSGVGNTDILAVPLNGKSILQLIPGTGTNEAEFSSGFRYFINTHSTRNTPPVVSLHDGTGKLVKTLKDNAALASTVQSYGWRPMEQMELEVAPGLTLNGWMLKPPGFQSRERYPVLVTQYSGPNSNDATTDEWGGRNALWFQMLAQKGYIVVGIDPRGTGRRGAEFRHMTYGQLGRYETEDLLAAARWLGERPFVDPARIGIWGWSYGGYMSSLCITKGADLFKAAIAVAPVTNW
ncbi:MAG: S9 family peptidase, partial [Flavobacteriales bacterium]|nr:S9 family peptidase [Flavobacteriales bacterium]